MSRIGCVAGVLTFACVAVYAARIDVEISWCVFGTPNGCGGGESWRASAYCAQRWRTGVMGDVDGACEGCYRHSGCGLHWKAVS